MAHNQEHDITPSTVVKAIREHGIDYEVQAWKRRVETPTAAEEPGDYVTADRLDQLEKEMQQAASRLDFERAAILRDRIEALKEEA